MSQTPRISEIINASRVKHYLSAATGIQYLLMQRKGYGAWNVYAALYGTPEQVDVNWRMVKGAFEASGGEVLTAEDVDTDDPLWQYRVDMMSGTLSMREFSLYNYRGGGGSTWFAPVSQAMGSETLNQMHLAKRILGEYGFDYVALFIIGWRDMHHIVDLLYDRTIPAETNSLGLSPQRCAALSSSW